MPNLSLIKYLYFDFNKVLAHRLVKPEEYVAMKLGIKSQEYQKLEDTILYDKRFFPDSHEWNKVKSIEHQKDFFDRFHYALLGYLNRSPDKQVINELTQFWFEDEFEIKPQTIKTLTILRKNYRLGIITNGFPSRRYNELKLENLDQYFEEIIISQETGYKKPQREIYDFSLSRAGVKHNEILLVDDNTRNVKGALYAGWKTGIKINQNHRGSYTFDHYFTINNIGDILTLPGIKTT